MIDPLQAATRGRLRSSTALKPVAILALSGLLSFGSSVVEPPIEGGGGGGSYASRYVQRERRPKVEHVERVSSAVVWVRKGDINSTVSRVDAVTADTLFQPRSRVRIDARVSRVEAVNQADSVSIAHGRLESAITRAGAIDGSVVAVSTNAAHVADDTHGLIVDAAIVPIFVTEYVSTDTHRQAVVDSGKQVTVRHSYLGAVTVRAEKPIELETVEDIAYPVSRREMRRAATQMKAAWKLARKVDVRLLGLMEDGTL